MIFELGYTKVYIDEELRRGKEYFKDYGKVLIIIGSKAVLFSEKFKDMANFYHQNGLNFRIRKYFRTNPSIEDIRNLCKEVVTEKYNCIIGIGGGSTIDLIKATKHSVERSTDIQRCLRKEVKKSIYNKFDFFTIPTTSGSGSHVSKYFVITIDNKKFGQIDWSCVPIVSFIDLDFLSLMPMEITIGCGFDVFSHCFESIISKAATPISIPIALEGLRRIIKYLPLVIKDLKNRQLRKEIAVADTLSGMAESFAMVDTLHAVSQPLNIACNIPHGYANLVVFIPWLEYLENESKEIPELKERLILIAKNLNISYGQLFPFLEKFSNSLFLFKPKVHLTKKMLNWLIKVSFETMQIAYDLSYLRMAPRDVSNIYRKALI